jgi:hypothetical protein
MYVGGVVGYHTSGDIKDVVSEVTVTASTTNGTGNWTVSAGGVAGMTDNSGIIKYAIATGKVSATSTSYVYAGGITGSLNKDTCTVSNCMALNAGSGDVIFTKTSQGNYYGGAGRVWGSGNGKTSSSRNYALPAMQLNGGVASDGTHDNRNGADIISHNWAFYTNTNNWEGEPWSTELWEWDNVNGRAKLK